MARRGHAQKGDGTETMGFARESKWTALEWQGDALERRCQAMEVHEWEKHRNGKELNGFASAEHRKGEQWIGKGRNGIGTEGQRPEVRRLGIAQELHGKASDMHRKAMERQSTRGVAEDLL